MSFRKTFWTLTYAMTFLVGTSKIVTSQQTQTSPPPAGQSIGQQAVNFVLEHYTIDAGNLVPKTGKPLSTHGAWAVRKNVSPPCSTATSSCVRVVYTVPGTDTSCEWTVLLRENPNENVVLDVNEDAARYLTNKAPGDPPGITSISKPHPIYPSKARMEHVQGTVKMIVHVTETGHVDQVTVISGPDLLRPAAMDSVKQWIYKPLVVGSTPVPFQTVLEVNFRFG